MADSEILHVDGPDGVREVRLSSPDKVLWPAVEGREPLTKRELVRYLMSLKQAKGSP